MVATFVKRVRLSWFQGSGFRVSEVPVALCLAQESLRSLRSRA